MLTYARIRPAINQVEVHPFWRNDALISFCKKEGIHVSAYCPMGTPWTSAKAVIRRAPSCSSVSVPSCCYASGCMWWGKLVPSMSSGPAAVQ